QGRPDQVQPREPGIEVWCLEAGELLVVHLGQAWREALPPGVLRPRGNGPGAESLQELAADVEVVAASAEERDLPARAGAGGEVLGQVRPELGAERPLFGGLVVAHAVALGRNI